MSSYEDYTQTSKNYDKTRRPVGSEITVGCLAQGTAPLGEMLVLDAGCGTGNYAQAVVDHVGHIEAVDLNPGMLEVAAGKLADYEAQGRISFRSAPIDELPFEDATFDGVMINQVLHHLPDDPAKGFPAHLRAFRELARVSKPDGVLVVNTCSQEQLRRGYWHYHLIPEAADALRNRYAPLDDLIGILNTCGFNYRGSFAPTDAPVQGEPYLNPSGPLSGEWRDGDSVWSLVSEDRLQWVKAKIQALKDSGELESYVARNDAPRLHIGQATVLFATREKAG
jgi:ubiquinone/menaquinone biosynthesis C-methylase UbiE